MLYLKCLEYYEMCVKSMMDTYSSTKRADSQKTLIKKASVSQPVVRRNELLEDAIFKAAQAFTNYDYADDPSGPGKGLYSEMHKYKSVSDFRKKKRKRRMETIKKLKDTKPK